MNGTYSTGKVPALIEAIDARTSETNHAGWTLAVVYENASLPLRDLTVWSGGVVVSPSVGSTDITLTDFITPDAPSRHGKAVRIGAGGRCRFGKRQAAFRTGYGVFDPLVGTEQSRRQLFRLADKRRKRRLGHFGNFRDS